MLFSWSACVFKIFFFNWGKSKKMDKDVNVRHWLVSHARGKCRNSDFQKQWFPFSLSATQCYRFLFRIVKLRPETALFMYNPEGEACRNYLIGWGNFSWWTTNFSNMSNVIKSSFYVIETEVCPTVLLCFWLSGKTVQLHPLYFLSLNMWQLGMSHWTALIKTSNWSLWSGMLTSKTYTHLIWGEQKKNISIQVKNVCYVKCISCAERPH